ncbi:LysE family translocator [Methanoculleus horonobensis]|jgi:threonine/homoserine/homoserine lactone efflux protein|uniref:LysE family translocator n=1 Tax=Methanoculleus horonobensis TaxID=528314 RepID=UPI0008317E3E|nr:LysE family transporter [Methanoculleus horonobensis]MDD3070390.1 LysE family transporter [Methanoculleus horonobensis]MDD4251574.1 LysE family transporter [Methanoculleus horonobensis]
MIEIVAASFLIGFSGAASPGPMTASVLGLGGRQPGRFVAGLVAGHGIPEAIMVAAIAFGVRDVPHIDLIALLGSGVLVALGTMQFLRAGEAVPTAGETKTPVAFGLACTLGNPYWWVWWLTFGVGFLALHPAFVEFYVGHIGADIVWLGLLAFAVSRGANVLGPHYKKVVQASGLAMILFGLYFILTILFA